MKVWIECPSTILDIDRMRVFMTPENVIEYWRSLNAEGGEGGWDLEAQLKQAGETGFMAASTKDEFGMYHPHIAAMKVVDEFYEKGEWTGGNKQ